MAIHKEGGMTNLEYAKFYLVEMKWSVIPLAAGTKVPPKGFSVIPYRDKYASLDELEKWFSDPKMNVGIVTGKLSNLLVVDLDKSKPQYKEDIAIQYFGDDPKIPITFTPSGGEHLFYKYPGENITIGEGILPAIDFRGEGGYIVAPPSINGSGNGYSWFQNCADYEPGICPTAFIKAVLNNNNKNSLYGNVTRDNDTNVTSVTMCDIWESGTRDKNLFHIANCLAKTNNNDDYIRQTLRAIVLSWGEVDEGWIDAKIKSALERQERKERNIQAEVDAFISVTTGDFSVTNMVKELGFVTPRDIATARKALSRRKDTIVEKAGNRDGWWRRIDTDIEYLNFDEPDETEMPIKLPFELHNLVEICEGNIILASGEFNSGKTLFAMDCLIRNKNLIPIRYMSSEMKVSEIKKRFRMFGIDKEYWWPDEKCSYVALRNNIPALILPDGLNIIDYIEFPEGDYTRGAEYMRQIHDKLNKGVAIVCNQQKEGARLPRSGDLILEKPRLAVTFRKVATENDDVIGIAEIIKAKNVKLGKMDGKRLKYEIKRNGSYFKTIINWGYWR